MLAIQNGIDIPSFSTVDTAACEEKQKNYCFPKKADFPSKLIKITLIHPQESF